MRVVRALSACLLVLCLCVSSCAFVRKELGSPVVKEGEQIAVSCTGGELTAANLMGLVHALESSTWEIDAVNFGSTLGKQVEACVLREIAAVKASETCTPAAPTCVAPSVAPTHAAMLIEARGITYK